eukprot:gene16889-20083_t
MPDKALVEELTERFREVTHEDLGMLKGDKPLTYGLPESPQYARSQYGPPIAYYPLLESSKFTLALFAMPKGSSMPLHSHPSMQVLSKMLYGEIHVDSYLFTDLQTLDVVSLGQSVMTPDNASAALSPRSIVHSFKSPTTESAVLELLFPPYEPSLSARRCTNYKMLSHSPPSSGSLPTSGRLQEILAEDFGCFREDNHEHLLSLHGKLSHEYSEAAPAKSTTSFSAVMHSSD